ncbi:MAG: hypothetical protein U5J83_19065 [Bryobacterales bacterium]|nr:hypothetical protein [Bryobacterales bacterium]
MGFLDNLENSLEALESGEERRGEERAQELAAREAERQAALRAAPHAAELKSSDFVGGLLTACRTVGHGLRVFVQFTWIGDTLRLDAKTKRLELQPTADGNFAVFMEDGEELRREPLNLKGDPHALAERWLKSVA